MAIPAPSRAWLIAVVVVAMAALTGCAGTTATPAETSVPITSIDAVKGKWAGILERTSPPSRRSEDWVELTVNEDGGYRFKSARTVGVLQGSGTLALKDGQLSSASEHGSATYRLVERGGKRVLKVDAVDRNGHRFSAELNR